MVRTGHVKGDGPEDKLLWAHGIRQVTSMQLTEEAVEENGRKEDVAQIDRQLMLSLPPHE
jgi:hypothetical protein